jgi:hypothetical protein
MKKMLWLSFVICSNFIANNALALTQQQAINTYLQNISITKAHKFNANQIRSFVYYWFSLHDRHANIQKSLDLLDTQHLSMQYPEMAVRNAAEYTKWYTDVGINIKSNLHQIQQLTITYLPDHRYQINVVVNWQAIDKNNKFIDVNATQQWILVDSTNNKHPLIQQYDVTGFDNIL